MLMRLIDVDALRKRATERCPRCPHKGSVYCQQDCDVQATVELIDTAPLVKMPQGKWDEIREPFGWDDILSARCSSCGESYPYPEDTGFNDIVEMFKYCPNCGAKMEAGNRWKEEEDEE